MDSYQDENAEDDRDPYSPMIQLGYNFKRMWKVNFSPQFFYAFTSKESNDSYGGDYSVKTFGILYDFVYPVIPKLGIRFGLGNVVKSIEGEGGTVTVPNGSDTTTAYKPGEKSKSHTGTLNLGVEFTFNKSFYFKLLGARIEYLISSPLRSEKRSGYLTMSLQGYF